MISYDEMNEVLKKAQLEVFPLLETDNDFQRKRSFLIGDVEYSVEWWSNIGRLTVGNLSLPFDNLWIDNFFPHKSKMDLRTAYKGEEYGAVIKLVDYQ